MKKLLIVFGIILSNSLVAQEMNKWSVGVSVGAHDGAAPTSMFTKLYQIHHYGINGRYMFNNRVGLMLDLGYDLFDFSGSGARNTNYFRTSVQGVVNAGDLLKGDLICSKLGLLVHGGAGISNMWVKKEFRNTENESDPLFKGVDDMVNYIFGATPQYKINERISLNADLSFIFHHNQTYKFDMNTRNYKGAIDGYFINLSIGASYYFGAKEKHADWVPTIYGGGSDTSYEARVKELEEKLKDDDMDGVPNYVDQEPNTVEGSYVDSKGVAVKDMDNDSDGDGVSDAFDICPNVKGTFGGSGCPDTDGDGISDNLDQCPAIYGSWKYQGCPEISNEVKVILIKALEGVNFETGKDVLTKESFKPLDEVVKVMQKDTSYHLKITGHTDNVGTPEFNLQLSKDRAQAVVNYLKSKGLSEERFIAIGFGDTRPVASNDSPEGRAKNRRVEFKIIY